MPEIRKNRVLTENATDATSLKQGLKIRSRVGAIFVTENGKQYEGLLGLLTAWDIAGTDFI